MAKRKKKPAISQDNYYFYLRRIETAESHRDSGYKELWIRAYKRYRNYVDQITDKNGNPVKDRSNISIPYTFTQIETIYPRIMETIFAARPYVTYFGREPIDEIAADNMTTLVDWQMNERIDIRSVFGGGLKELCIYGTAIAFVGWKLRERTVIRKTLQPVMDAASTSPGGNVGVLDDPAEEKGEPMAGNETGEPNEPGDTGGQGEPNPMMDYKTNQPIMDWQPTEVNVRDYDDPDAQMIDLGTFFVDPTATDIDDARYCGHQEWMTKDQIQDEVQNSGWIVNWDEIPNDTRSNTARDYRMSSVGLPTGDNNPDYTLPNNLYEVHKYWEDDKEVVMINRRWIALERENPFWHKRKPYCKTVYCEVPHEFYGMGVVEMCEDLQDELNNERNMRIDFRAFVLRRMFKVRRGANVKREQLVFRQGGIIDVNEMDDVEEMGVKDAPASTFNQEGIIKQDMQDATGAHDVVMGTSDSSETATTTMSKDNNAAMRFKLVIYNVEKNLLCGVARFMMQLNQQYMDQDKVMRVTGEDGMSWMRMSPEDIQGEFDLTAAGSSVEPQANKEAFKQRMVDLFTIASKDPFYMQFPIYRRNLLKKVFQSFDIKDTDGLLPTDQELQAMMQPPQPAGAPMMPPGPAPAFPAGGGANTAPMQEPALQVVNGGGQP